jgi:integrase
MKRRDLQRLLETAGDYRRGYEVNDSRTAAIVLLSTSAAIGPVHALRWTVADVVKVATPPPTAPQNGQWAILPSVPVKNMTHVLPIDVRAALLVYLRFAIWAGVITSLHDPRLFPLSLRAVQIDVRALMKRAGLEGLTFHDLKRQQATTRRQAPADKPRESAQAVARGTLAHLGTEPTTAPPLAIQTPHDPAQTPPGIQANE